MCVQREPRHERCTQDLCKMQWGGGGLMLHVWAFIHPPWKAGRNGIQESGRNKRVSGMDLGKLESHGSLTLFGGVRRKELSELAPI